MASSNWHYHRDYDINMILIQKNYYPFLTITFSVIFKQHGKITTVYLSIPMILGAEPWDTLKVYLIEFSYTYFPL